MKIVSSNICAFGCEYLNIYHSTCLADEFVRVVGIGKGAGLLANKGLLNSFSSKINQPRIPRDITDQDVDEWEKLMERLEKHNRSATQ